MLWEHWIPSDYQFFVTNIENRNEGGYVIFGSVDSNEDPYDNFCMVFIDDNGWQEELFIYPAEGTHFIRQGIVLPDGYVLAGSKEYDDEQGEAIRTDLNGAVVWQAAYTSGVRIDGVTATPDGGFAFCGYNLVGTWDRDWYAWILKTDEDGDIEWEIIHEVDDYRLQRITADEDGTIYGFGFVQAGEGLMWVLGRPEPEPTPQVTIFPLGLHPESVPAEGRMIRYYLGLKNDRDVPLDVRIRRRAYTPSGSFVPIGNLIPFTLPAESQHTYGTLHQPMPGWAPPGSYVYFVELLAADSDSVIAQDSIVLRKFESQ